MKCKLNSYTEFWFDESKISLKEFKKRTKVAGYQNYLHREEDLPAVILPNIKIWYKNGKRHRENGPASIIEVKGIPYYGWYLNDIEYIDINDYLSNNMSMSEEEKVAFKLRWANSY